MLATADVYNTAQADDRERQHEGGALYKEFHIS